MNVTPHLPRLAYGIKEACQAASVGRSFIYSEMKVGRLKSFKAGSRTLIAVADLETWLDGLKRHAA